MAREDVMGSLRYSVMHLAAAGIVGMLSHAAAAAGGIAAHYQFTDLGALTPYGINDLGQIAGVLNNRPALWLPSSAYGLPAGANDLGTPPGWTTGQAFSINNLGQIAGNSGTFSGLCRAAVWLPSSAYGMPAGWTYIDTGIYYSAGFSMTNSGQVAGIVKGDTGAFEWQPSAANSLPAGTTMVPVTGAAQAYDVNSRGQVVGETHPIGNPNTSPFVYLPEPAFGRPSGVLGLEAPAGADSAQANAINEAGVVVGIAHLPTAATPLQRPYVWDPALNYAPRALAAAIPAGGSGSTADHVNDAGLVVGEWSTGSTSFAYVDDLNNNDELVDLNTRCDLPPNWHLGLAYDVNNRGDIIGFASVGADFSHAFLLTAIAPEPGVALAAIATAAMFLRRRSAR
jgi:uncharacterized membrane protein